MEQQAEDVQQDVGEEIHSASAPVLATQGSLSKLLGEHSSKKVEEIAQNTSAKVKQEVRVKGQQVSQDAKSLGQWALELSKAAVQLYFAGVRDSIERFTVSLTPKQRSEVTMSLVRFFTILVLATVLRDYIYEWLYWGSLGYANEAINFAFVEYEYLHSWAGMAEGAKESLATLRDKAADSKFVRSISNLTMRRPSVGTDATAAEEANKSADMSKKKRRAVKSEVLAQVLVAKVMSYCFIWAYLQEMVETFAFVDLPLTALLLSYFMAETRLLLMKNLTFVQRLEHIKSHIVYHLGFGTLMVLIFMYAPYGEQLASIYHLLILCTEHRAPKMDKRLDLDVLDIAEKACSRVLEYVI